MILTAGALVARQMVRPRPNETASLVDWERVRRRAIRGSGESGPTHLVFSANELGRRYDDMLTRMRPWIAEALDQPLSKQPFPNFSVLDRRGWIEVNLELFKSLVEPVLKLQEMVSASLLTDLGRTGISEYMGVMLGFLSRRVLGQYDPVLMAPGVAGPSSLYLVEPNIEAWEAHASVQGEQLRQWLVLHEVTHVWEFEANPWLREHLNSLIRDLIAHRLLTDPNPRRRDVIRALTIGVRSQWQAMSQIQATMSLLEGFSNVMMRRVGAAHLPHYEKIDSEFSRRSQQRGPAERAFFKITGLDLKMQQYVQGERFCNQVIEFGGMSRLSRIWSGPHALPTLEEIRQPELWLRRST
ncbi:MAG TPA: zinc-dependent metalloprotease [Candidatus Dormibacteraeota bacterium]|nr:zinc-dependent metalloprotease [Candidatus Dormibacteraeota bacterium]